MKEKIIAALANKYANLGVGKKALDGVATFIEKNVTTEDDIENAVAGSEVLALLKAIQGESDSLRQNNAQLKKRLDELEGEGKKKLEPPTPPSPDDKVAEMLKQILDKQSAVDARITEFESRAKKERLLKEAEDLMIKGGASNAYLRGIAVKGLEISDTDTASTLAERGKAAYNDSYTQTFGHGPVPPTGGQGGNEGYKQGQYAGIAERLRASGKLPKTEAK